MSRPEMAIPAVPASGSDMTPMVIDLDTDTGLLKSRRPVLAGVAILAGPILIIGVRSAMIVTQLSQFPHLIPLTLTFKEEYRIEDGPAKSCVEPTEEQPEDPTINECVTLLLRRWQALTSASGECDVNCKFGLNTSLC